MNINDAFPSDYLKASDLKGQPVTITMAHAVFDKIGDDTKIILHLQGTKKMLVLNKTNANTIASVYGPETENWFGQQIEVFPTDTDYQGQRVPCVRVRRPQNAMGVQPPPQNHQAPLQNGMGQQTTPFDGQSGQQNTQGYGQGYSGTPGPDLDDEIPF